jgi:hypothetical protein
MRKRKKKKSQRGLNISTPSITEFIVPNVYLIKTIESITQGTQNKSSLLQVLPVVRPTHIDSKNGT